MYKTPPRSVINTRRAVKKEQQAMQAAAAALAEKDTQISRCVTQQAAEPGNKANENNPGPSTAQSVRDSSQKRSSTSSILARKKKLELEAAEAKAKIRLELIDKKLEADITELEDEGSSGPSLPSEKCRSDRTDRVVNKWLERSEQELQCATNERHPALQERILQHVNPVGPPLSAAENVLAACPPPTLDALAVCPPPTLEALVERPPPALDAFAARPTSTMDALAARPPSAAVARGTDDLTVQALASALKDLAAASAGRRRNSTDERMLNRLCTPRELPKYSGDPLEWLHFRQAYDESSQVCDFTDQENLWRLRRSLHGPAKEAVTALLIGATSADDVMSTLELQFGNPDVIVSKILQDINKLRPMSQEYQKEIIPFSVKVRNCVAAITAIGEEEYLKGMNLVSAVISKLPIVLISKWTDYSYPLLQNKEKPKLVVMSEFLSEEAKKISMTSVNLAIVSGKQNYSEQSKHRTLLVNNESDDDDKCRYCRVSKHKLQDCKKFKKSLRRDRWTFVKRHGMCYKCLLPKHKQDHCPAPACDVDECGQSHHRLLHYVKKNNSEQSNSVNITDVTENENESGTEKTEFGSETDSESRVEKVNHLKLKTNSCKVLLKTVPIYLHGPNGIFRCVALLDDGSTVTLISAALASKAGLSGERQSMRACGAWNNSEVVFYSEMLNLKLSNCAGEKYSICARSVNNLNLPVQNVNDVDLSRYELLKPEIKSAISDGQSKPDILIGQDNYELLLPLEIIKGQSRDPFFTRTPLGWCMHGCVRSKSALDDEVKLQSTLFLSEKEEHTWPGESEAQRPEVRDEDLEYVNNIQVSPECLPAVPEPEKFSSWLRLVRATFTMLSFIDRCRKVSSVGAEVATMERAENLLLKYSQMKSFPDDLHNLKLNKRLDRKSKLLTLSPVLGDDGLLRLAGRIDAAPEIPTCVKQPIILDGHCHVTHLLVKYHHVKAYHGNQELVVNELKQKYWIIKLRPTVKYISSKCMLCRIKKAQPAPPRMSGLPEAWLAQHQRPLSFTGLDLFGPLDVSIGKRREKRYGVIFTCLTVRAIHIEIVNQLTADALIMALRRMAARRGWPLYLYSDNGTNLRGADTELKKCVSELDQERLKEGVSAYSMATTWIFIPPASPHWGGAWERLIRSIKSSLKVILKERAPRDETLQTLMVEVEHVINSRPLTHVSVEPTSGETLTPNHFLLGTSSNLPTLGTFDESDTYLRKQWRLSQKLADMFWKRWVREILPDMRPRQKCHAEQKPLQKGDLVLIVDPNSPRNIWPKGLVQNVITGKDGRIRVVDVITKSGILRRNATRVARIAVDTECCSSTRGGNVSDA